jgi:hypothetical protein
VSGRRGQAGVDSDAGVCGDLRPGTVVRPPTARRPPAWPRVVLETTNSCGRSWTRSGTAATAGHSRAGSGMRAGHGRKHARGRPRCSAGPWPACRPVLSAAACAWGAQTRFPSAPGCSWRPSTRCVDPTCWSSAGPLLDSAASSCRSLPTRLRGRCPRSRDVWHHDDGQTLARAPCAHGPLQVCRQTTGLDQRPECDHAAGDRCGTLGRRRPGFPSDFPPPNMGLRETGRNGRGRCGRCWL